MLEEQSTDHSLAARPGGADSVLDDASGRIADGGAKFTPGLETASVPAALEQHFAEVAPTAWTYTRIRMLDPNSGRAFEDRPGIVVGSQVTLPSDGATYTLYYLFPLDDERETLALVTRALLTAAVLLLVLVAGLTWLVTRQVVTPIRLARRVADRLAPADVGARLAVRRRRRLPEPLEAAVADHAHLRARQRADIVLTLTQHDVDGAIGHPRAAGVDVRVTDMAVDSSMTTWEAAARRHPDQPSRGARRSP